VFASRTSLPLGVVCLLPPTPSAFKTVSYSPLSPPSPSNPNAARHGSGHRSSSSLSPSRIFRGEPHSEFQSMSDGFLLFHISDPLPSIPPPSFRMFERASFFFSGNLNIYPPFRNALGSTLDSVFPIPFFFRVHPPCNLFVGEKGPPSFPFPSVFGNVPRLRFTPGGTLTFSHQVFFPFFLKASENRETPKIVFSLLVMMRDPPSF